MRYRAYLTERMIINMVCLLFPNFQRVHITQNNTKVTDYPGRQSGAYGKISYIRYRIMFFQDFLFL